MVVQRHLTFWTDSLFNKVIGLRVLKFTKPLFAHTPNLLNGKICLIFYHWHTVVWFNLSRETVSVSNKHIADCRRIFKRVWYNENSV